MSVIIEIVVPRESFELGRILTFMDDVEYTLETIVPLGEQPVPFIRVHDGKTESLVEEVTAHPAVHDVSPLTVLNGEEIYSLIWDHDSDDFLSAVRGCDGHVLSGDSFQGEWQFRLEFPDREAVSAFDSRLDERGIEDRILSVVSPWVPGHGLGNELTTSQREALELAREEGYYDLPRKTSTNDLAAELGISDQAVSERLRRGIATLIDSAMWGD